MYKLQHGKSIEMIEEHNIRCLTATAVGLFLLRDVWIKTAIIEWVLQADRGTTRDIKMTKHRANYVHSSFRYFFCYIRRVYISVCARDLSVSACDSPNSCNHAQLVI